MSNNCLAIVTVYVKGINRGITNKNRRGLVGSVLPY